MHVHHASGRSAAPCLLLDGVLDASDPWSPIGLRARGLGEGGEHQPGALHSQQWSYPAVRLLGREVVAAT